MFSHKAGKTQCNAVLLHLRSAPHGGQHAQYPFKVHRENSLWATLLGCIHTMNVPVRSTPTDLLLCLLSSLRKRAVRGVWLHATPVPSREWDAQEHLAICPAFLGLAF